MNSSRAEPLLKDGGAEKLIAENKALKTQLAHLQAERIPSLESELAILRASAADAQRKAGQALPAPANESAKEAPSDAALRGNVKDAADVGDLLGLEPVRRKYFEESYERLAQRVREAEKRHATISREGAKVEIHIPPFPDEGRFLSNEWSQLLDHILTPSERERYRKLQLNRVLFPREIGLWDRVMEFEPQKNPSWPTSYERWTEPGEKEPEGSERWPWSGYAALRCYRHFLELLECKALDDRRQSP